MARSEVNLKALAREHGFKYNTLYSRVRLRGWSLERALTTPLQVQTSTDHVNQLKRCSVCETVKPLAEFHRLKRRSGNEYQAQCKVCDAKRSANDRLKLRRRVIDFYSDGTMVCIQCGEDRFPVLDLDHIHGDGKRHRPRKGMGGYRAYQDADRERDRTKYRVLCRNCNWMARWEAEDEQE